MSDVRNKSAPGPASPSTAGAGGGKILYRAVVSEFIGDPSVFTAEKLALLKPTIGNENYLLTCPRNSCIVRIVTDNFDKQGKAMIAYPLFPPHICMPIKPGEQVWLISEGSDGVGPLPYWISRIPENSAIDDLNFTHGDRKLALSTSLSTAEKSDKSASSGGNKIPSFENGDGTIARATLRLDDVKKNPYDDLIAGSESYKDLALEPVPRFTKRPGDMTIQGSNNTLICLGEERGWGADSEPDKSKTSNAIKTEDQRKILQAGAIDIVVGRGRFLPASPTSESAAGEDPKLTAPRVIANSRKFNELDKNPGINKIKPGLASEGDPDLVNDSSRVYLSMRSSGDLQFGIDTANERMAKPFESPIEDIADSPFAVIKSDQVRIIARKNEEQTINGGIRIVKEGTPSEDLAVIALLPDGTVQVSGSKIFLGRTKDDGGAGGGPGPGEGQPYVKYQQLEDLLKAIIADIKTFCDTLSTHTTPGYGAPSPQILSAQAALKAAMATRESEIANIKSERIFGE